MNNLITYTDFKGAINIPNIDKDITSFNTVYIAPCQKNILIKLLGYHEYINFEIGLDEATILQKWIDLRDGSTYEVDGIKKENPGVKNIIANYTFCEWCINNQTQLTGIGAIRPNSDNSENVSIAGKYGKAWNDMVLLYRQVYSFLIENSSDYPDLDTEQMKIYSYGI
jgi:hypothetical protein